MDKQQLAEIGRRAAEAAVAAATAGAAAAANKDVAAAAVARVESGGTTTEFKLSTVVIAAIVALAAGFGFQLDAAQQVELVKSAGTAIAGIASVYCTVRTWRKNAA